MSDKMREEFDAWLAAGNSSGCNNVAWKAWQASRAALVVELPNIKDIDMHDGGQAYIAVRDAIHASGVTTK